MKNDRAQRRQAGFTLMEIMVVIAIIGLLATLVGPQVMNRFSEAKQTATKTKMATVIQPAIEDYIRHFGKAPETLEALLQNSDKNMGDPYLREQDVQDAWGERFLYNRTGGTRFELMSYGADGMEGGDGEDADIDHNKMPGS